MLSSGACWFCFRSEVYSLFFCKPHNSRHKCLLVAIRLGMLHLGATCKQMRPFSVGCTAKDVSSGGGELAIPHKCHNPRRNLRWLRSLEASYHWHFFLRSSHCAIFMSTLKVSEVYLCSSILSLSQCSPFTLFLHSVSSKKKIYRCFS